MNAEGPLVGVLGGMGPLATAQFMSHLARLADARCDQDHCRSLVYSNPRLPDRSRAILEQGPSPLSGLLQGIAVLERCGADVIVIPCNSAHFWLEALVSSTATPILSMVDAVLQDLDAHGIGSGRVGLLATGGLLRSGIYQQRFAACGFETIEPTEAELSHLVEPAIRAIKAGDVATSAGRIRSAVAAIETRGVRAVVLGCTELPLALTTPLSERGTPLIDSARALAAACLAWTSAFPSDAPRRAVPRHTYADADTDLGRSL